MSFLESKRGQASAGSDSGDRHFEEAQVPEVVVNNQVHSATALPERPELGAEEETPPAYSEVHDRFSLHQAGFDAGASITGEQSTARRP